MQRREFLTSAAFLAANILQTPKADASSPKNLVIIRGQAAKSIPEWAGLQRELIKNCADACEVFYAKYFDENGYFQCFERWGANDGPDDAIENVNDWPILHAIGARDIIKELYSKAWVGHLKQYSHAKTIDVPAGRNGMYSRNFPVMNDWQHLSEGLTAFNSMGLSDPHSAQLAQYAVFVANLYNGRDKIAKNYDPKLKIIKSMMTGSNGPLLRDATPLEWAGDPFDTTPFFMEHGEHNYTETLEHYIEYKDVVGDSPLNLQSTSVALTAYMFTGESYIRQWICEYVYAWADRMSANGGIIPSKVSLEGKVNSAGHPWWSGVYGWNFNPLVPQTGKRETRNRVLRSIVGFFNVYLLTKDDALLQLWRNQAQIINQNGKMIDGELHTPTMFGENGWYEYQKGTSQANWRDIWYFSMKDDDLAQASDPHPWTEFLKGKNPDYPQASLKADLAEIARRVEKINADTNTKNTRLADAVLGLNTALVTNVIHQTMGGIRIARPPWSKSSPQQGGAHLFARLRHFDPQNQRSGLPEDVCVLVTALTASQTKFHMINLSKNTPRTILTQIGGFGEHHLQSVMINGKTQYCDGGALQIILHPLEEVEITINHKLNANQPSFKTQF